jgi:DNA-binding response OmpR family regulator
MHTILIVDDDRSLRASIREILEEEGYRTKEAANGEAALSMLKEVSPDLVLVDMVMPGMDGLSLISLLRKDWPGLRIVVMTAYATVQDAVQSLKQGADDYIAKPFKIHDILTLIRKNLQESRFHENENDVDLDAVLHGVANLLRRKIILLLYREKKCRFMELVRKLEVRDHTKVNFHLKVLREAGMICQDDDKVYRLTDRGEKTVASLSSMIKQLLR